MKKPDRIARVVEKAIADEVIPHDWRKAMGYFLRDSGVIKLLHAEHRAVVRLVKQEMRAQVYKNICNEAVRLTTCERLLAALARRAR